jgi:hypothetical protein
VLRDIWYDLEYPNVIMIREDNEKLQESGKSRLGVLVTGKTKRIGCSTLKDLVENNQLEVTEQKTLTELKYFVRDDRKGTYSAESGHNDDLVMGLVNFAYFSTRPSFLDIISSIENPKTKMREIGTKMAMEMLLPEPQIIEPEQQQEKQRVLANCGFYRITGSLSELEESELESFLSG